MKKLLALTLSVILMLSLCCCGGGSTGGSTGGSNNGPESKPDDPKPSSNPYVGVWHHAKTDDEPFTMTLRIFEDGKADMGKESDSYTMSWKEADGGIVITTTYSEYLPKDEPASLLEDGTLKWNMEFKTSASDKTFEYVIFKKQ